MKFDLDVFALIDSDTDEARAFTTYLNYWKSLNAIVDHEVGSDRFPDLLSALIRKKAFKKLTSRRCRANPGELSELLRNAWTSETALHLVATDEPARVAAANQWNQVYAYYATSRMVSAWLASRDGQPPTRHRALLDAVSAQATNSDLLPPPWCLACENSEPRRFRNFASSPPTVSNLASDADAHGSVAKMLATTRERDVATRVENVKRQERRQRARNGERARQERKLKPTTVFDFLWRTRTRSNYGDPSLFFVGTLSDDRSVEYCEAIQAFVSATMFVFESLISQRNPQLLEETAVHFISRDRSRISEDVIAPRLRVLGLLQS